MQSVQLGEVVSIKGLSSQSARQLAKLLSYISDIAAMLDAVGLIDHRSLCATIFVILIRLS